MQWTSYLQSLAYSTVKLSSSSSGTQQTQTRGIAGDTIFLALPNYCKVQPGEMVRLEFPGTKLSEVVFIMRIRRAGEGKAEGQITMYESSTGRLPISELQKEWEKWNPDVALEAAPNPESSKDSDDKT